MSQDYLTNAFIRLRQRLRVITGRVIADSAGAEDVLQDSFVRLWRKHYPLQSEKEAEALLTRAVKNASLNEKRRKRGDPLVMDIVDESQDAEERERTYDELKRKIDRELTSTQKYILEEKEYGGRTYRAHGSSFSKVDRISVHSSSRDCSVRMRFFCQNGDLRHADSSYFVAEWVRTIPFEEGLQTVLVALPFGNHE